MARKITKTKKGKFTVPFVGTFNTRKQAEAARSKATTKAPVKRKAPKKRKAAVKRTGGRKVSGITRRAQSFSSQVPSTIEPSSAKYGKKFLGVAAGGTISTKRLASLEAQGKREVESQVNARRKKFKNFNSRSAKKQVPHPATKRNVAPPSRYNGVIKFYVGSKRKEQAGVAALFTEEQVKYYAIYKRRGGTQSLAMKKFESCMKRGKSRFKKGKGTSRSNKAALGNLAKACWAEQKGGKKVTARAPKRAPKRAAKKGKKATKRGGFGKTKKFKSFSAAKKAGGKVKKYKSKQKGGYTHFVRA